MIQTLLRLSNNVPKLGPLFGVVVLDSNALAMGELRQAIGFLKRQLTLFDSLNSALDSLTMFRSQ